jgi:hypothetical protein
MSSHAAQTRRAAVSGLQTARAMRCQCKALRGVPGELRLQRSRRRGLCVAPWDLRSRLHERVVPLGEPGLRRYDEALSRVHGAGGVRIAHPMRRFRGTVRGVRPG